MSERTIYVSKPEYADNIELAEEDPVERVLLAHQIATTCHGLDSIEDEHEFTLDCPACYYVVALLIPDAWLRRSLEHVGRDVERLAELYVVPPSIVELRLAAVDAAGRTT
jgi:hypothetical protein